MSTIPEFLTPPRSDGGVERAFGVDGVLRALGIAQPRTRCGRYTLLEKIGEGGMGVVYRAHDPELDRDVALKLLREDTDEHARARLRREAQSLARLNDARVVTVFAVGEQHGQTWIAMELVRGQTLAQWAGREHARRFDAALDLLLEAGRGLAAAHRAGLVHRDFKPSNVLLRDDGQVKVADFGLARSAEQQRTQEDDTLDVGQTASRTTACAGTPTYMAPEQHLGLATDTRCDQYAFALTAWELLAGAPPFRARTLVDLAQAKLDGVRDRGGSLPGSIRRVLLRALSPDPDGRFDDMPALLNALQRARSTRIRIVSLTALTSVALVWLLAPGPSAAHPCAGLDAPAWDQARRDAVHASFSRNGALAATEAWARVENAFDAYATDWARARDAACTSASPSAIACLEGAARGFDEAVGLATSDPEAALRGAALVEALPRLPCELDDASSTEHREIETALARAAVLREAGQHRAALEEIERIEPAARRLEDLRTRAAVSAALGDAQARITDGPAALQSLQQAHALAVAAGDDDIAMEAALSAVEVIFEFGQTSSEIEHWLGLARVAHERLGRPASIRAVWLHVYEAQHARSVKSDYERALDRAHAALALAEQLDASSAACSARAAVHQELADLHFEAGDFEQAEAQARLVVGWTAKALGADHPATLDRHSYLSDALVARGRYDEALAELQIAFDGARAMPEPDRSLVAALHLKASTIHRFLEQYDRALVEAETGLRMLEEIDAAPDLVANALAPLSVAQQLVGDLDAARATGERIVAILEAELGPDHVDLAPALYNLGDVLFELGRYAEAAPRFRRSLEIAEANLGPHAPQLAYPLRGLGEIAVRSGDFETARPLLSRARTLASQHHDAHLQARIESAEAATAVR